MIQLIACYVLFVNRLYSRNCIYNLLIQQHRRSLTLPKAVIAGERQAQQASEEIQRPPKPTSKNSASLTARALVSKADEKAEIAGID